MMPSASYGHIRADVPARSKQRRRPTHRIHASGWIVPGEVAGDGPADHFRGEDRLIFESSLLHHRLYDYEQADNALWPLPTCCRYAPRGASTDGLQAPCGVGCRYGFRSTPDDPRRDIAPSRCTAGWRPRSDARQRGREGRLPTMCPASAESATESASSRAWAGSPSRAPVGGRSQNY